MIRENEYTLKRKDIKNVNMIKDKIFKKFRINYNEYKDNIYNYFSKLYGYDSCMDEEDMNRMVANIINAEIRGKYEVCDGDDIMWYSPEKDYKFEIYRYDVNPNLIKSDRDPKFNIVVKVYDNNINIKICEFNFSEIDAIRILDEIANFNEYCYQTYDSTDIFINPSNTDGICYMIDIENIFETEERTLYGKPITINNDVRLKILEYGREEWVPVVTMKLSLDELNDFAFTIFFYSLIDLDIDDSRMDNIENYIVMKEDYGYGNMGSNKTDILYDNNAYSNPEHEIVVNNNPFSNYNNTIVDTNYVEEDNKPNRKFDASKLRSVSFEEFNNRK